MEKMMERLERISQTLYQGLIEYETPRLVKVHNVWLGMVIRLSQVMVIAYVISYAIVYERGYQVTKVPKVGTNQPVNGLVPFPFPWSDEEIALLKVAVMFAIEAAKDGDQ